MVCGSHQTEFKVVLFTRTVDGVAQMDVMLMMANMNCGQSAWRSWVETDRELNLISAYHDLLDQASAAAYDHKAKKEDHLDIEG